MLGTFSLFALCIVHDLSPQPQNYAYCFYSLVRTSYIKHLAVRGPASSSPARLYNIAELALGALAQVFTIPVVVIATCQKVGVPHDKGKAGRGARRVLLWRRAGEQRRPL